MTASLHLSLLQRRRRALRDEHSPGDTGETHASPAMLRQRTRRPHPWQCYDSGRDARIPGNVTTAGEIPANPTTMTTKGRARRIASMVFVRRRGDVSWHVRTSVRRQCLILGAAPEPSIVNRYLRRCNGRENARSLSVDFVDFAPLWCDHHAMSRWSANLGSCPRTFNREPLPAQVQQARNSAIDKHGLCGRRAFVVQSSSDASLSCYVSSATATASPPPRQSAAMPRPPPRRSNA